MKNQADVLLSRNFVEFGPLTLAEFSELLTRKVIHDSDFVHRVGSDQGWYPASDFLNHYNTPKASVATEETSKPTASKKATAKAAAAKAPAKTPEVKAAIEKAKAPATKSKPKAKS